MLSDNIQVGRSESASIWWLHPAWTIALAAVPALIAAYAISPEVYSSAWGTQKYVTLRSAALYLVIVFFMMSSAWYGARGVAGMLHARSQGSSQLLSRLEKVSWITFTLSLFGYLAWAVIGLSRGLNPIEVLGILSGDVGAIYSVKGRLAPVAGLTTFTQFAPVAVAGFTLLRYLYADRRYWRPVVLLMLLGGVRTLLYAERLATVELVVPLVIAALLVKAAISPADRVPIVRRPWRRRAVVMAPLWAPALLLLFFSASEYLRSWSNYYQFQEGTGFASFAVTRMWGYYVTGINNGEVMSQFVRPSLGTVPYFAVDAIWSFPGVSSLVVPTSVFGLDPAREWSERLRLVANVEFNNTGGVMLPITEFGAAAGILFWCVLAYLVGRSYAGSRRGQLSSIIVYAVSFVGLLELTRLIYWTQGRGIVPIVAALLASLYLNRREPSGRVRKSDVPL